MRQETYEKLG